MRYTLENEYLCAEISELGATLCRLIDKKSGVDLVLGFDTDEGYLQNAGCNIGATIGRNANSKNAISFFVFIVFIISTSVLAKDLLMVLEDDF